MTGEPRSTGDDGVRGADPGGPDGRSGDGPPEFDRGRFFELLGVRRNAALGAGAGAVAAVATYAVFVVLPGTTAGDAARHLVLAFVVAVGVAVLVAGGLTARVAVGVAMDTPKWVRRAGTAAAVAGAAWAGLGAVAAVAGRVGAVDAAGPLLAFGWVPAIGLAAGLWGLSAATRPHGGGVAGRLRGVGAAAGAVGYLLAGRAMAVDAETYLGVFDGGVGTATLLGVHALALAGTALVAPTVRVDGREASGRRDAPNASRDGDDRRDGDDPRGDGRRNGDGPNGPRDGDGPSRPAAAAPAVPFPRGPALALVAALPVGVGGAALAVDAAPGLVGAAVLLPTGLAWTAAGAALRAGRGVPPAAAYGPDLPGEAGAGGTPAESTGEGADPGR